jgi:hypothetical protein
MKYKEFTLGQIEALINMMGGRLAAEKVLKGELRLLVTSRPQTYTRSNDQVPAGWSIVSDVDATDFEISLFRPAPLVTDHPYSIKTSAVRAAAEKKGGNLGLVDGLRLLERQEDLPTEFRRYHILLPGTILARPRDLSGTRELVMPCLSRGSRRTLFFVPVEEYVGILYRLACPSKD